MVRQVYELRIFHGERQLSNHTIMAVLDFDDPDASEDLLNRHLLGAALRAGADRDSVHEFVLEAWESPAGPRNAPVVRWALPVDPEATL